MNEAFFKFSFSFPMIIVWFDDILNSTDIENLDVIPSGFMAPNPSEMIGSRKMAEFVQFLAALALSGRYQLAIVEVGEAVDVAPVVT